MSLIGGSPYTKMQDNVTPADEGVVSTVAAAKFCSMGVVSSEKWFACFIAIYNGVFHLYDSEQTFRQNPSGFIMQISLTRRHQGSEIKAKNYSENPSIPAELHCFYIEQSNGIFFPSKEIKIGSYSRASAQRIISAVEQYTKSI
jgi:hypothetical protein